MASRVAVPYTRPPQDPPPSLPRWNDSSVRLFDAESHRFLLKLRRDDASPFAHETPPLRYDGWEVYTIAADVHSLLHE